MSQQNNTDAITGIVIKKLTAAYQVRTEEQVLTCTLAPALMAAKNKNPAHSARNTAPPSVAVGDQVRLKALPAGQGMILEVLPRRNSFGRRCALPMPDKHPSEQVIVANVDQLVAVFAMDHPAPRWNLLDRYLVTAEASGLPALICMTRLDLLSALSAEHRAETLQTLADYQRIGYAVIQTSVVQGAGLDELRAALQGQVSVLVGKSGVGKSSLLNGLQPGLGLRTAQVSAHTGKGRHTTSHLEMVSLNVGGAIVDTPGMREFGLWDIHPDELGQCFPEMRPYLGACKFGLDCSHDEEPGCAIRRAVMNGEIHPRRYRSYLRLRSEP
ncbi:MAG: ribosome small subunit-dependent GTPase A [Chloroflexota bacterium]